MIEFIKTYGIVLLLSMMPISELRGAIPAGIAMGLKPWLVWFLSTAGNLIPVPFIMLFIRRILEWMRSTKGFLRIISNWLYRKAEHGAQLYYRYELIGLLLLVAIPLPGTGAWTGALVASLMNIRLKTAIPAICFGVLIASIVLMVLTLGFHIIF